MTWKRGGDESSWGGSGDPPNPPPQRTIKRAKSVNANPVAAKRETRSGAIEKKAQRKEVIIGFPSNHGSLSLKRLTGVLEKERVSRDREKGAKPTGVAF